MNVVLSQTLIDGDNMARIKHHLPSYLHPYVVEGEKISHFFWMEDEARVTFSIVHGRQYGLLYRKGERVCAGYFDESLCLMVAGCCGVCYRLIDSRLVALDESEVDQHVVTCQAVLPPPLELTYALLPTPMMTFPKRKLGRVNRHDSHGFSRR